MTAELDSAVADVTSLPEWKDGDATKRRGMVRDFAAFSASSGLPETERGPLLEKLYGEAGARGFWGTIGYALGEAAKSVPAGSGALVGAVTDLVDTAAGKIEETILGRRLSTPNKTAEGTTTRLKEGFQDLGDSFVQRIKSLDPNDYQELREKSLVDFKTDLDGGAYPPGLVMFLSGDQPQTPEEDAAFQEGQQWFTDWSDVLLKTSALADHGEGADEDAEKLGTYKQGGRGLWDRGRSMDLLGDYLATRDPASWDGVAELARESELGWKIRFTKQKEALTHENFDPENSLLDDLSLRAEGFQRSPIDMAMTAFPLFRGAKAVKAAFGGRAVQAIKETAKSAAGEFVSGAATEALSRSGSATTGQVMEQGGLEALGGGTATAASGVVGAAAGLVKQKPDVPQGTDALPLPAGLPAETPDDRVYESVGEEAEAEKRAVMRAQAAAPQTFQPPALLPAEVDPADIAQILTPLDPLTAAKEKVLKTADAVAATGLLPQTASVLAQIAGMEITPPPAGNETAVPVVPEPGIPGNETETKLQTDEEKTPLAGQAQGLETPVEAQTPAIPGVDGAPQAAEVLPGGSEAGQRSTGDVEASEEPLSAVRTGAAGEPQTGLDFPHETSPAATPNLGTIGNGLGIERPSVVGNAGSTDSVEAGALLENAFIQLTGRGTPLSHEDIDSLVEILDENAPASDAKFLQTANNAIGILRSIATKDEQNATTQPPNEKEEARKDELQVAPQESPASGTSESGAGAQPVPSGAAPTGLEEDSPLPGKVKDEKKGAAKSKNQPPVDEPALRKEYAANEKAIRETREKDLQAKVKKAFIDKTEARQAEIRKELDAVAMIDDGYTWTAPDEETDIRESRAKDGATGSSPAVVESRLKQRWGVQKGGIVTVLNEPGGNWYARAKFQGGKLTGIELNAGTLENEAAVDEAMWHEISEAANADGALDELLAALSPEQQAGIRKTVERLGYHKSVQDREAAARGVEALAKAFSMRTWWEKAVARIMAWAKEKLGMRLTQRAAEAIAARQVAAVHEGVKGAFAGGPGTDIRESRVNPFEPRDWQSVPLPQPLKDKMGARAIAPFEVQAQTTRAMLTGSALPSAFAKIAGRTQEEIRAIMSRGAAYARDLQEAMKGYAKRSGQTSQQVSDLVNEAMENPTVLAGLADPVLQTRARTARNFIDVLSEAVANTTGGQLASTIRGNAGQWMRRGYAAFDQSAGWDAGTLRAAAAKGKMLAGRDARKILTDARAFLQTQHPAATTADIEVMISDLTNRDAWQSAVLGIPRPDGTKVSRETSSFMKRKDIPPEIRALMGEELNPLKRIARSIGIQAQLIARFDQQRAMRDMGISMGIFQTSADGTYHKPVGGDDVDGNMRWNGFAWTDPATGEVQPVYTTPEMLAALDTATAVDGRDLGGTILRAYKALGSEAKMNKVALNPDSWAVNILGNVLGMVQSGDTFHFAGWKRIAEAVTLHRSAGALSGDAVDAVAEAVREQNRALLGRMAASGVAGQSFDMRDLEASLDNSVLAFIEGSPTLNVTAGVARGAVLGQAFGGALGTVGRAIGGAVGGVGGGIAGGKRISTVQRKIAQAVLSTPDNIGKIAVFLGNYASQLASGMTDAQAFAVAAEKTRNTMPDYAKLPHLLREGSKLGLLGSFIAFQHEVYRNYYWNARYAVEELRSGNKALVARGLRRMLGTATVTALGGGLISALAGAFGGGTDDEKDIAYRRSLGAPWERFGKLAYTNMDKEGASFFNTSYIVPQVTLFEVGRAAMEGKTIGESMSNALSAISRQFAEGSVHADPTLEAITGQRMGDRGPVSYEEGWRQARDRIFHILKVSLEPGAANKAERIAKAARGEEKRGRKFTTEEELVRMLGVRKATYRHEDRIRGRLYEMRDAYQNARAAARKDWKDTPAERDASLARANERIEAIEARWKAFNADMKTLEIPAWKVENIRSDVGLGKNFFRLKAGRNGPESKN